MKILFVVDQYLDSNNGTTITTRRFAHELMRRGHEVRVACQAPHACWDEGVYVYSQPQLRIPLFQGLVDKQGMTLAKADPDTMRAALKWCDVAHFLMPFSLENSGVKMARQMGVPVTAPFTFSPKTFPAPSIWGNGRGLTIGFTRRFMCLCTAMWTTCTAPAT